MRDVANQVKRDKGNHWESHDISSEFILDEICKANQMVVHQNDEDFIVLLPKVNILSVGLEPADVNNHENT